MKKAEPTSPAPAGHLPTRTRLNPLAIVLLIILAAGLIMESLAYGAKVLGARGQAWAVRGETAKSLALAEQALRLNPDDEYAQYLRAAKLRETGKRETFKEAAEMLLIAHPNQASVRRLAGEAAYAEKDFKLAGELLWQAMWINPTPPSSPANYWRMTMMASQQAGELEAARRAAYRALALADEDQMLSEEDRAALHQDAGYVLGQAGGKAAGAHLAALARLEKARAAQRRR